MRILIISLACAALLMGHAPAPAAPVSRIAAVVNGDMITARELDRHVQSEMKARKILGKKDDRSAAELRKAVLESMINEKLVYQQAAKEKIKATDEEIDRVIAEMMKESNLSPEVFKQQLVKEGITQKELREQAKLHILTQKLISRNVSGKVVVTENEINEYYRRNMGMTSGRARVALLVYPVDADARKWAADIAAGKVSFAEAARRVSVGPNPREGGDMGFVDISDMAPALARQIAGMKKGQVSPLMNMGRALAQVSLLDVEQGEGNGAKDARPDEATARQIEQILRQPRLKERFEQYTAELRNKALIDIRN